ncbi:DUF29 family protein [Thiohalorhabdus sp.]|uniref:DUF29 family protein n=1 Tax=Thiohalorhabdus sp. TaxID=3094134 RepID=UPI002FC3437E
MASPETDFHAWLLESAELVEHGRWEDVDLEGLAGSIRDLACSEVRDLQQALRRWLEAGVRRDGESARREMKAIRERLARSPSLAAYEPLRQRVHAAWRDLERHRRQEGTAVPRVSQRDLDRATGKIRHRLGGVID